MFGIRKEEKFKKNTEVYFICPFSSRINYGRIDSKGSLSGWFNIKAGIGMVSVCEEDIFLTEEEAKAERRKRNLKIVEDYSKDINSKEDLLTAMFKDVKKENYHNPEKMEYLKDAIKKYLDIEIK